MRPLYLAVFLEEKSAKLLQEWFADTVAPLHERVYCHHMTVAFKPSESLLETFDMKYHACLKVTGYGADETCQAVSVGTSDFWTFPIEAKVPHITVSTTQLQKPFYSNELLAESRVPVIGGPELGGWSGFWDAELKRPCFRLTEEGPTMGELSDGLETAKQEWRGRHGLD